MGSVSSADFMELRREKTGTMVESLSMSAGKDGLDDKHICRQRV
jgi:hypothetical protein